MEGEIINRTVNAMESEIRNSPFAGTPAKTVFFGGGTPTFLDVSQLGRLIKAILETHPIASDCEITSEANPGTVDASKFETMRKLGFNRISLGAQSFNTQDLVRLGRVHESSEIARAVGAARNAGFDNINLDLMFGLMGQSLQAWKINLQTAMSLNPEHLSLYCLTIEPNTRFYRLVNRGMMELPDDELQVQMYDCAVSECQKNGYKFYEISNFSKPGRECLHNLCYWNCEEYLGYGPGAVGCVTKNSKRVRYTNTKHPELYSSRVECGEELWSEHEELGASEARMEKIMLGLRLNTGIGSGEVKLDPQKLRKLEGLNWITQLDGRITLTELGRHYCSEVVLELI